MKTKYKRYTVTLRWVCITIEVACNLYIRFNKIQNNWKGFNAESMDFYMNNSNSLSIKQTLIVH